jgi:D-alanine-D-alanine ligase
MDETSEYYVLEVNTLPGMTSHSLLPKAAEQVGMSFGEMCLRIIELAEKNFKLKLQN